MTTIVQPTTITDMRRNPKKLLSRVKKERVLPILVHSKFEAAIISIEELEKLYEELRALRHEQFVEGVLEAEKEIERGESYTFDSIEDYMKYLKKQVNED